MQPAADQTRPCATEWLPCSGGVWLSRTHLDDVWNTSVGPSDYDSEEARSYREAQLQQYFKFVDSAEKVSDRRALANTFFLTVNSAIVTVAALFWENRPAVSSPWLLLLPLAAALALCFTWYVIIRSHRQLNGTKWALVGELEERLPLRLWSTEWRRLDSGTNQQKYLKLTVAEQLVPIVFAVVYVVAVVVAIAAQ